jgi:hypothetical protein
MGNKVNGCYARPICVGFDKIYGFSTHEIASNALLKSVEGSPLMKAIVVVGQDAVNI